MFSRRARQFAETLDTRRDHAGADEVTRLVRTADAVTAASSIEPDPDFADDLRSNLMSQAQTALVDTGQQREPEQPDTSNKDARPAVKPRRRLVAAAAAAVVIGAGAATVTTSTQSMPGDTLYPVKLRVESVQSQLHHGDFGKGDYQLAVASKRLDELAQLSRHEADPGLIARTLNRFTSETKDGAARLFEAHETESGEESVDVVRDFAQTASTELASIRTSIPSGAVKAYRDALGTMDTLAGKISTLCVECDPDSLAELRSSVSDAAEDAAEDGDGTSH